MATSHFHATNFSKISCFLDILPNSIYFTNNIFYMKFDIIIFISLHNILYLFESFKNHITNFSVLFCNPICPVTGRSQILLSFFLHKSLIINIPHFHDESFFFVLMQILYNFHTYRILIRNPSFLLCSFTFVISVNLIHLLFQTKKGNSKNLRQRYPTSLPPTQPL